jgi:hypothetical protein
MADRSKFEAMLELLVNEDKEGAEALFHEIVVEKSRDIYESLLEDEEVDEASDEEVDEASDEEVDESDEDLDEADEEVEESDDDLEEGFDLDEFEVEADPMMGGDPADDMMGDMEPDMDDEDGDDMDMDDKGDENDAMEIIHNVKDEIEELEAKFAELLDGGDKAGDEEGEEGEEEKEEAFTYESADEEVEEAADEEVEEAADEEVEEAADEEVEEAEKTPGEQMREYVEKVAPAKHGDNGANTKSSVAGKNDMGGTTANILRADTEESGEAGAGTTIKGNPVQKQAPAAMNTKNINVPGGKAGKTSFKKKEPGHGAETKGKPETADKAAGSTLNKLSKRAK